MKEFYGMPEMAIYYYYYFIGFSLVYLLFILFYLIGLIVNPIFRGGGGYS